MAYDKHIDKSEEGLMELNQIYNNKNDYVNRFIDGLESGRITSEEDVIEFTNYIRESDGLTQLEYSRLVTLKESGFLKKYATNFNKRYSTAHMLMNRAKSSISRGLKMLEMFCSSKRHRGHSSSKRKVTDSSKLGKGAYTPSYWGLELYKESVKVLFNEVVKYMQHLNNCIKLCIDMNNQVNYVRHHPEIADEIFEMDRKERLVNNRSVIKRYIDMNADMENELIKKVEEWKSQQKSLAELKAALYHTLDEDEFNDWIICDEVMAARRDGLTNPERAIWGDNKQQVMRCRVAYSHLDLLSPKGQKDHIGGMFLARLYKWSKTKLGHEKWHTYFVEFYKQNGGSLIPVKPSAVKAALGKMVYESNGCTEETDFNEMMDNLVKKYMITTSDEGNSMKAVVNF